MTFHNFRTAWRDLGAWVISAYDFKKTGLVAGALLPDESLLKAAEQLYKENYFLEDVSCAQVREGFLVSYHFDSASRPGRLVLRVLADSRNPEVGSIEDVFQGAEWHERETHDFFGVCFLRNPNLVPLLLDPEHKGPPPLRKAEKDLAPLAAFNLFGEAEILNPAAAAFVPAPKKAEEGDQA